MGYEGGRGDGATQLLTFGWEPSAMVEREKLSLCSSDGVRYLQESSAESRTPPSPRPRFGVALVWGAPNWRSGGVNVPGNGSRG